MPIGATFDALESKAHHTINRIMGECWKHVPTIMRPNMPPMPDLTKPAYDFVGVWCNESHDVALGLREVMVNSNDPSVTTHKNNLRYPVRTGDIFVRLSTGQEYEAKEACPDTVSGIKIRLLIRGEQL